MRSLSAILNDGPMPSVPVDLVGGWLITVMGYQLKQVCMLYDRPRFTLCLWCAP